MKTNINLLSTEGSKSSGNLQLYWALQKVATVVGIIVVILGVLGGGYILFKLNGINNIKSQNEELGKRISALEATEQQFIFVRDRVDKVKTIFTESGAQENTLLFGTLASAFPSNITISEAEVRNDSIKISFSTTSSSDLIGVFTSLSDEESFKMVDLENFSFNQTVGYVSTVKIFTN